MRLRPARRTGLSSWPISSASTPLSVMQKQRLPLAWGSRDFGLAMAMGCAVVLSRTRMASALSKFASIRWSCARCSSFIVIPFVEVSEFAFGALANLGCRTPCR